MQFGILVKGLICSHKDLHAFCDTFVDFAKADIIDIKQHNNHHVEQWLLRSLGKGPEKLSVDIRFV